MPNWAWTDIGLRSYPSPTPAPRPAPEKEEEETVPVAQVLTDIDMELGLLSRTPTTNGGR